MLTANAVDKPPARDWSATGALSLPEIWRLVEKHRAPDLPMTTATFVTICFEETACCNMVQSGTPAAIGPGQMQVSEIGKVEFFANPTNFLGGRWDSSMTIMAVDQLTSRAFMRAAPLHRDLPQLTKGQILADAEFAIKMQLKYFQWLARGYKDGKPKGLDGLLAAQTGGGANVAARQFFKDGASALEKLMTTVPTIKPGWTTAERDGFYASRRLQFKRALNIARGFHKNPVPESYEKFWEFFLPNEFLESPMSSIPHGS